jgi:anaphase-promoting complex subunit 4
MTHGYTRVIELTHENLLPALDRCSIILSSLQGLAQYHEHSTVFNVPLSSFGVIIDIIRCMRLLAHQILVYANEEQRQFSIFSKWLRHEIDIQATDPNSASAGETAEQDMGIDYTQLLAYLQGAMEESKLKPFVVIEEDPPAVTAHSGMYDDVKKSLKALGNDEDGNVELLNLQSHFDEWKRHNRTLVDQITSHQRESSFMNCGLILEDEKLATWDMKMIFDNQRRDELPHVSATDLTTYCAMVKDKLPHEGKIISSLVICCRYKVVANCSSSHPSSNPFTYLRWIQGCAPTPRGSRELSS